MIPKEITEDTQSLSELSRDELTELLKLLDSFIKQGLITQHFWLPSRIHPGRDYSIFFPKELDEIIPRFSSKLETAFKSWLDGTIRRLSAARYKSLPILKQLDFEAIEVVEFEKLKDALYEIILSGIKEAAEAGNLKAIANIKLVSKGEISSKDYSKSFELSPQLITQLKTTSRALANRLGNDLADKVQFQILEGIRRREGFPEIRRRVMMELSKRDLLVEDLEKNLNRFKNYEEAIAALGSRWNFPESWEEKLKDAYELTGSAAAAIDGTGFVSNLYSRKAELIARTETIRAVSEATLERYEASKVVQMVEFEATGDERLCEECASLDGKQFTLEESHGIIPVHHECRCFIDGQVKIFTSKGWESIKAIKVEDLVLTHDGRFRKVKKIFQNPGYKGEFITVHLDFNVKISVTPEHPFYVKRNDKDIWIEAQHLERSDKLFGLAKPCSYCGKLVFNTNKRKRKFRSFSCSSKDITKRQWSNPNHRKNMSEKISIAMKRLHRETDIWKASIAKCHQIMREKAREGTHPFQRPLTILKARRSAGKNNYGENYCERRFGELLRRKGLFPEAQYPIKRKIKDSIGRDRYYFSDWALPEFKIAFEIDGEFYHNGCEVRDMARQKEIEEQGWAVLRYKANEVKFKPDEISKEIDLILMNHSKQYYFLELSIRDIETRKLTRARTRYNLQVEEDESYIASGVVVHNCTWIPVLEKGML